LSEDSLETVAGVAKRLKMSESFIYRACETGVRINGRVVRLTHYKLGRSVRLDPEAVRDFLRLLKVGVEG